MIKFTKIFTLFIFFIFSLGFVVLDAYAAGSINVDAAMRGYEQGNFQELKVVQELEEGLDDELDDYDSLPVQNISDPFEPWNRFWFGFNDIFFLYIARPLHQSYSYVVPEPVRNGLSNFFHNLLFPVRFVSSLLQGRPLAAGAEFSRFLINTTVGLGGFVDVAKHKKTIVPLDPSGEDMDQTFGVWGIGTGPYIVWPIIGPNTVRGTFGLVADYFLDPTYYFATPIGVTLGAGGLRFNDLGPVLDLYADTKQVSVDPYIAVREAYAVYKQRQIKVIHE